MHCLHFLRLLSLIEKMFFLLGLMIDFILSSWLISYICLVIQLNIFLLTLFYVFVKGTLSNVLTLWGSGLGVV